MSRQGEVPANTETETSSQLDSLVVGGVLLVSGVGSAAIQAFYSFKEGDLSGAEHALSTGSIFLGGLTAAGGAKVLYDAVREVRARDRQQG